MKLDIVTIPLGFGQCYVLKADGVIAIDAGAPGKAPQFAGGLRAAGIKPEEVKLILLTHGHWDHVGSAEEIKVATGAQLALHRSEVHWLENSLTPLPPGATAWGRAFMSLHKLFTPWIRLPAAKVDLPIGDDGLRLEPFGIPGRVYHTPGHSPGSVSLLLDTGDVFVGDLAMNKFPLRLSPGLPIFADDLSRVIESWELLLRNGATTVYPAHGRPFPATAMKDAIRKSRG